MAISNQADRLALASMLTLTLALGLPVQFSHQCVQCGTVRMVAGGGGELATQLTLAQSHSTDKSCKVGDFSTLTVCAIVDAG